MKTNIVLCGFMASGKTTVGRILSQLTGKGFVDTDSIIEERMGMNIRQIFSELGERYFRGLERDIVIEASGRKNIVIALGGGAVLDPENVKDIRKEGIVYLLKVSPEEAVRRSKESLEERPLMGDQAEDAEILMRAREDAYLRAADVVIETDDRKPEELAKQIANDFKDKTQTNSSLQNPGL
ncbi:MAG: shikimate kinase [Actinomycetota bacterium]|nr:shikimate kinase [Actinomycetota bacterium]